MSLIFSPSTPNGAIINGVAHFVQPTNPTARVTNGVSSPLVVGDKNYRSDLKVDTFWNGTYWLSEQVYQIQSTATLSTTISLTLSEFHPRSAILIKDVDYIRGASAHDGSNYYGLTLLTMDGVNTVSISLPNTNLVLGQAGGWAQANSLSGNGVVSLVTGSINSYRQFGVNVTKVGLPSNTTIKFLIQYHLIVS